MQSPYKEWSKMQTNSRSKRLLPAARVNKPAIDHAYFFYSTSAMFRIFHLSK
jgi:hypothetical protein